MASSAPERVAMMSHSFVPSIRVVSCDGCGAPIEAELRGGTVTCGYCRATNHVRGRDDARDRGAGVSGLSEAHRLADLRRQAEAPVTLPASLGSLVTAGMLAPGMQETARAERLTALRELRRGGPSTEAERLYHLTLLLAPSLDPPGRRALLEDALEDLPDVGHRHVLRCALAQEAALTGDASAARQWLSGVPAHSNFLEVDSRYRIASAMLAVVEDDLRSVTLALGTRLGDVPLSPGTLDEAALLLAHVKWKSEGRAAMEMVLREHLATDARRLFGLRCAATRLAPLAPCGAEVASFLADAEARVRAILRAGGHVGRDTLVGSAILLVLSTPAALLELDHAASRVLTVLLGLGLLVAEFLLVRRYFIEGLLRSRPLEFARLREVHTDASFESDATTLVMVPETEGASPVLEQHVEPALPTPPPPGVYPCLMLVEHARVVAFFGKSSLESAFGARR